MLTSHFITVIPLLIKDTLSKFDKTPLVLQGFCGLSYKVKSAEARSSPLF